ncbi:MAG: CDP-glycerol--poly(glycerophosphate) glycerophosphotransferase [Gammaproteobacteria bacterium]|nr:CDP-glycerol--poly(glycerophosphate) glycerophosphotransferase [Gammaproteobacteria bacterium]
MKVLFDAKNIYYLPQYSPVIDALLSRGHQCECIAYEDKNDKSSFNLEKISDLKVKLKWVADEDAALNYYLQQKPDWIFFGNQFSELDKVHQFSKTAQLGHGVGPKNSYYSKSNTPMTVRFIEGAERLRKIQAQFPDDQFVQVGYSKLDPLFSSAMKGLDIKKLGLDPNKKTILYAPTFNPSSIESFPDNWPEYFPDLNILIKAHAFSWQRKQYRGQRRKLNKWARYDNTYVALSSEISLLPFMISADLLVSEASSTLFEFVALDKPVIVCDFYFLKWFYRGPFRYRFERRFKIDNVHYRDIGVHVENYGQLKSAVIQQLENPQQFHQQRMTMTEKHIGPTDGKVSQRIVDYLESNLAGVIPIND